MTCEVANDTRIGIATGNATGVYFALGNAYAEQIGATGGKVKATAAETGASVQNIQQLVAGSYDVAFSLADTRRGRGQRHRQLHREAAGAGARPHPHQLHPGDRAQGRRHQRRGRA